MVSSLQKWLAFFGLLLSIGCSDSVQRLTKTVASPPAEHTLFSLLNDSSWVPDEPLYAKCAIDDFYSLRNHKLVWHQKDRLTPQADSMLSIIHHLSYLGLIPEDYHLNLIDDLAFRIKNSDTDTTSIANFDIFLTDALFTIASHLRYGRIEEDSMGWKASKVEMDSSIMKTVSSSLSRNDLTRGLQALEPQYLSYQVLKRNLKRKLDTLNAFADLPDKTRIEKQIIDLSINMEQWRWERQDTDSRYILVNIPAFQLELINHDSLEFQSKVVVGTPFSPTPTLDASILNFVLFPTWNVPRDIATRELLPKIKRDSLYLVSNRYRVLDMGGNEIHPDSINWSHQGTNHFPYMIQQLSGTYNALGLVKFTFSNPYNIYLHDTNAKRFFQLERRAFSHGCVRVERALELAEHLVQEKNRYCSSRDFDRFMREGLNLQVNFNPIDLRIRYYTCETHADGTVVFHDDIYGRNAPLVEAIYCKKSGRSFGLALSKNFVQQTRQTNACL
jgi:L,D-transpeptidase YcbB